MAALNPLDEGSAQRRLVLILIGAMAAWGLNMSAVKVLSGALAPLSLAASRMVLAALALGVACLWGGHRWRRMTGKQWLCCVACAVTMVYGYQVGLVVGLRDSSATNASLIVALIPLLSFSFAVVGKKARPHISAWLGLLLGLGGVMLVVLSRSDVRWAGIAAGDGWLLAAAVSFAIGGIIVQGVASELGPLPVAALTHALGASALVLHASVLNDGGSLPLAGLGAWQLVMLMFSGVVAAAAGNLVWYRSIATFGAARTSPALYLVPMFGLIFAWSLLGEAFSGWQVIALAAILAGCHLASAPHSTVRDSE